MKNQVFVFGSNEAGIHGAGAAQAAYKHHGARWHMGYGHYGNSFAIPTKGVIHSAVGGAKQIGRTLPLDKIRVYVDAFLAYAEAHPELTFNVTRIGCGLAGLRDEDIAPMFAKAPVNCLFDTEWQPYLKDTVAPDRYWGSYA